MESKRNQNVNICFAFSLIVDILNIVIGLFINKKGENMKKLTCHCGAIEAQINI